MHDNTVADDIVIKGRSFHVCVSVKQHPVGIAVEIIVIKQLLIAQDLCVIKLTVDIGFKAIAVKLGRGYVGRFDMIAADMIAAFVKMVGGSGS